MNYKNVAFIPVRGGSKSIPLKNIKIINGRPLVYWTLDAAIGCKYIDRVFVATDSEEIRNVVKLYDSDKVEIINRSEATAGDSSTTESAMLEFAEKYDFENIVLIQATSPLLEAKDLDKGFEMLLKEDFKSILSVVRQKRFIWRQNEQSYFELTFVK
ncbi:acylneuraminate cytidylyltransferase family protein [Tissierella sp.]|uniref:acylneuraminate cytidylyltransferase family protein n=1 Tax=Tissierella sp. TaxID=41274 RepID=UPI00304F2C80